MSNPRIKEFANQLYDAEKNRKPTPQLSAQDPSLTVADAYDIQLENVKRCVAEGHVISGKKIGLTSVVVQKQAGVDEPDYGHLFKAMESTDGTLKCDEMIAPKIESEIAFVLKDDLKGGNVTVEDVKKATDYVCASFEVVDSRICDWKIRLVDTVADNASSGRYVLGEKKVKIDEIDLPSVHMDTYKDGEKIGEGEGSAVLGDPCYSVAWLANKLWSYGVTLNKGEVVLSGALAEAPLVSKGEEFVSDFGEKLGKVSVKFI